MIKLKKEKRKDIFLKLKKKNKLYLKLPDRFTGSDFHTNRNQEKATFANDNSGDVENI